MTTTRTVTLVNTLQNLDLTPKASVAVVVSLLTPTALAGVDLDNVTIFNGALSQVQTTTDAAGAYSIVAAYPGDVAPAGCALVVNEAGQITVSPAFAYTASPILVSSWYPVGAAAGSLLMLGTLGKVDTSALQGSAVTVALASRVTAPDAVTVLPAGLGVGLTSDSHGHFFVSAYPTALCTPNNIPLVATYADGSFDTFTVPATPTGFQGAYAGGTTYHANAGTKASPADVVTSGGLYYQYINATPAAGHAPASSPTYWQLWPGEPIEWNITLSSPPGLQVWNATNIGAIENNPGSPHGSPVSVQDVLDDAIYYARHQAVFGASGGAHAAGDVPDPGSSAGTTKFLREDATWQVPPGGGSASFKFGTTITANYVITGSEGYNGFPVDATSADITVTLPTAVGNTQRFAIKRIDSSAHLVTVLTPSAQTIDGLTTFPLVAQYQVLEVESNNTNWDRVAGYYPSPLVSEGDMLYLHNGALSRLLIGSAGQVLTVVGGGPAWAAASGGGAGGIWAPMVNGDLPGPTIMATADGQVLMVQIG